MFRETGSEQNVGGNNVTSMNDKPDKRENHNEGSTLGCSTSAEDPDWIVTASGL